MTIVCYIKVILWYCNIVISVNPFIGEAMFYSLSIKLYIFKSL